jgi:hypothetical protein
VPFMHCSQAAPIRSGAEVLPTVTLRMKQI